jgi:hypothetical protein
VPDDSKNWCGFFCLKDYFMVEKLILTTRITIGTILVRLLTFSWEKRNGWQKSKLNWKYIKKAFTTVGFFLSFFFSLKIFYGFETLIKENKFIFGEFGLAAGFIRQKK